MLTQLNIENIILIENARLIFGPGLNVLSGETGSGKSAVIQALALAGGKRAECTSIRRGADKGLVEAVFQIDDESPVHDFLREQGIECESGQVLRIQREISSQGRSRSFLNSRQVPLSTLRDLGPHLLEMVAQHATQSLLSVSYHRHVLDSYGQLKGLVADFECSWHRERALHSELTQLIANEARRESELARTQEEVAEIEEAALREEEEDEVFAEYTRLTNVESSSEKLRSTEKALCANSGGVLSLLRQIQPDMESLSSLDPKLTDVAQSLQSARVELEEASYSLSAYQGRLERNPQRIEELNDRLAFIRRMKRKYGPGLDDVLTYLERARERIVELTGADERIEMLQNELARLESTNDLLAKKLSELRKEAGETLAADLSKRLQELNMPGARMLVELRKEARQAHGDDHIEFFIAPNIGEDPIPARDCASGGELSRIMLALTAILSHQERIPTLVFDEVDANIGGETAAIVGEKLRELGTEHQILCITHFPQVAQAAHQHLRISKTEIDGRMFTQVAQLNAIGAQKEMARMMGGKATFADQLTH